MYVYAHSVQLSESGERENDGVQKCVDIMVHPLIYYVYIYMYMYVYSFEFSQLSCLHIAVLWVELLPKGAHLFPENGCLGIVLLCYIDLGSL